jgi:hypothetical protein
MAEILYLNKPTRDSMKSAREYLFKCFDRVKAGKEQDALRFANKAVAAYEAAMNATRQSEHKFLFKGCPTDNQNSGSVA